MFTGVTLEYEVALVPREADVRSVRMAPGQTVWRLGWMRFWWRGRREDRNDVRYGIHDA